MIILYLNADIQKTYSLCDIFTLQKFYSLLARQRIKKEKFSKKFQTLKLYKLYLILYFGSFNICLVLTVIF